MKISKLIYRDKAFYKRVFSLALPIALQSLITIGVNMLDTIMVGKLGENALSATSLANSFITIYHILCMGLGMGAAVLVSRYWGMKQADDQPEKAEKALRQTVCLMLRLALLLASLFALATLILPGTIMKMYTDKDPIIERGIEYFRYSVVTYFFWEHPLLPPSFCEASARYGFPCLSPSVPSSSIWALIIFLSSVNLALPGWKWPAQRWGP